MTAPADIPELFEPATWAQLENLELLAGRVVDGMLAGRHRSNLKGGSAEFTEHRGYVPGDEIRLVDWKVYGKSDRYYIRQYIDQTCLQVILAVDASGSMAFGLGAPPKFHYARAVAACLARLVLRQSDAAGLALFNGAGNHYLPPRSQPRHLQAILQALRNSRPAGETDLAARLTDLARRIRRRGLIILLSDCFGDLAGLERALQILRARGHEVILFHTLAPEELHFDFGGWSRFECLEVEGRRVDLDPAWIRADYLAGLRQFLTDLKRCCGKARCDYESLTTDLPLGEVLSRYLTRRSARLKQG